MILSTVIMMTVLWLSLGFLSDKMQSEIHKSNANAIHQLKQFSVMEAVLIEDYGKLILDFQAIVEQLNLDEIVLYDTNNNILASSKLDQVGERIDPLAFDDHCDIESISSGTYVAVYLAYCFNNDVVTDAIDDALAFGLLLTIIGLMLMAAIGYIGGAWLSLRLERMVDALDIITDGHIEKFTVDESKDEIGMLSRFVHTIGTQIALQKEELIDSEERMRLALQSAGAGAWKYDVKNTSLFWTAKIYQIFGIMPSDEEPSMELWSSFVHPEDLPLLTGALSKLFENRENLCVEYRIIRRSGAVRWVRSVGRLFVNANDEPEEAYGMLFDISHHKSDFSILESERNLLSTIFDHTIECFLVVNVRNEIVTTNQKAREIFRISNTDQPVPMASVFSSKTIAQINTVESQNLILVLADETELAAKAAMNAFFYQDDSLSDFTVISFTMFESE